MKFHIAIALSVLGVFVCVGAGVYLLAKHRPLSNVRPMTAALVAETHVNPVEAQIASHAASIKPCGTYDFATRTLTIKRGFAYIPWGHGWFDVVTTEYGPNGASCRAKLDVRHVVMETQAQR